MFRRISVAALALTLALSFTACSNKDANTSSGSEATGETRTKVRIGVVGENNEQWVAAGELLKEKGIDIELVRFGDYSLPNQALADGEIELNSFQHYAYLNNEIASKKLELTPIGETVIAPLGVYSSKIESLDELPENGSIAIPSDATNGGRALKVLESAGVITVKPEAGFVPTLADITSNPKNIKFYEVEAAQTYRLMADVDAAVINGGHARDNGLNPSNDSIYLERVIEGVENPYINIIVARTADKDSEIYKTVVDSYRSDEVAKVIDTLYDGIYIKTW